MPNATATTTTYTATAPNGATFTRDSAKPLGAAVLALVDEDTWAPVAFARDTKAAKPLADKYSARHQGAQVVVVSTKAPRGSKAAQLAAAVDAAADVLLAAGAKPAKPTAKPGKPAATAKPAADKPAADKPSKPADMPGNRTHSVGRKAARMVRRLRRNGLQVVETHTCRDRASAAFSVVAVVSRPDTTGAAVQVHATATKGGALQVDVTPPPAGTVCTATAAVLAQVMAGAAALARAMAVDWQ